VVADHSAEGPTGQETIVVTPQSVPPLRSGFYFFRVGLFSTGIAASGSIMLSEAR
jgi:hypothetical protein